MRFSWHRLSCVTWHWGCGRSGSGPQLNALLPQQVFSERDSSELTLSLFKFRAHLNLSPEFYTVSCHTVRLSLCIWGWWKNRLKKVNDPMWISWSVRAWMFARLCLIVLRNDVTSSETYRHLIVIFLFVHPCWMRSLANFSVDLDLQWKFWMKTLLLCSGDPGSIPTIWGLLQHKWRPCAAPVPLFRPSVWFFLHHWAALLQFEI